MLTGIVFGGCGKRSDPSCRGGDAEAGPSFGARDSKEAPLLYQPSRNRFIVVYFGGLGAGDNGNRRKLTVTIARGTNALDHSFAHAQCIVWGLLERCGGNENWAAFLLRWRFSLCTQGKGTDFPEEKSLEAASPGRADVSRGDRSLLSHFSKSVSHSSQSNYINIDLVSPVLS